MSCTMSPIATCRLVSSIIMATHRTAHIPRPPQLGHCTAASLWLWNRTLL
jgi:hypothetical protein